MLQIIHYTKQYTPGGKKAVDDLSLHIRPGEIRRKKEFKAGVKMQPKGITRHKCAVCGRTEVDSPNLEFRFCSKCNGNYEYCQDHLFNHVHVK